MPEEQEAAAAIDPSKILVRAMPGFLYSPLTKLLYYTNTREAVGPYTFERPWSIAFGYDFDVPVQPLNPVDFPTPDTAQACLEWARSMWPTLVFAIVAPTPTGGFTSVPQFWLVCNNHADLYEIFSAGWWMFDLSKDGEAAAYEQRSAELRAAGFSF